jgi:UDP-2,3-diacylglucosamine pyrophosphatase LpxH
MVIDTPETWLRFEPQSQQCSRAPTRVRTVWISDVHLGTRASGAGMLLDFLREYECETLYIVGDLIDIWQMRRGTYWPQQHNDVVQKILRKSRKGTRVVYIPGNHDEMVASFCGAYGNIAVQKHLSLNPFINFIRRRFGLGYWSLSAYAKQRVKNAVSFISKFEEAVGKYAERYNVDAVLCGHIHSPSIRRFGNITYYNCGDWVETSSALIEDYSGRVEIVRQRNSAEFAGTRSMLAPMRC